MSPLKFIRERIFGMKQTEFARVAGTTQATVCRWEGGTLNPNLPQMNAIRAAAIANRLPWDDRWFFEVPTSLEAAA